MELLAHPVFVSTMVSLLVACGLIVTCCVTAYRRGGVRQLIWPTFHRGYEVNNATRLAALPWAALFVLSAAQLVSTLFADELSELALRAVASTWLPATIVTALVARLIHGRHSIAIAAISTLLLAIGTWLVAFSHEQRMVLWIAVPFLLWSINGVRATRAEIAMG